MLGFDSVLPGSTEPGPGVGLWEPAFRGRGLVSGTWDQGVKESDSDGDSRRWLFPGLFSRITRFP